MLGNEVERVTTRARSKRVKIDEEAISTHNPLSLSISPYHKQDQLVLCLRLFL